MTFIGVYIWAERETLITAYTLIFANLSVYSIQMVTIVAYSAQI